MSYVDEHDRPPGRCQRLRSISQRPSEVNDEPEKYKPKIKVITASCGHDVEHPKFISPEGNCWGCYSRQGATP